MRTVKILAMGAAAVVLTLGLSACGGDTDDAAVPPAPVESSESEAPKESTDPAVCTVYTEVLGEGGLAGAMESEGAEGVGAKYREVGAALDDGELKDAWNDYGDYLDLTFAVATDTSKLEEFTEKTAPAGEWLEVIRESMTSCA